MHEADTPECASASAADAARLRSARRLFVRFVGIPHRVQARTACSLFSSAVRSSSRSAASSDAAANSLAWHQQGRHIRGPPTPPRYVTPVATGELRELLCARATVAPRLPPRLSQHHRERHRARPPPAASRPLHRPRKGMRSCVRAMVAPRLPPGLSQQHRKLATSTTQPVRLHAHRLFLRLNLQMRSDVAAPLVAPRAAARSELRE